MPPPLSIGLGLPDFSRQGAVGFPLVLKPSLWVTADPAYCFSDAGGTVPCGDGDAIQVWKDRSGNNNTLTQATLANRPLLKKDAANNWYAFFDATPNDVIATSGAVDVLDQRQPFVLGFVGNRRTTAVRMLAVGNSQVADGVFWDCASAANLQIRFGNLTPYNALPAPDFNTTGVRAFVLRAQPSSQKMYFNGTNEGANGAVDVSATTHATRPFAVGEARSLAGGASLFWQGTIKEVIAIPFNLSDVDFAALNTYLTGLVGYTPT